MRGGLGLGATRTGGSVHVSSGSSQMDSAGDMSFTAGDSMHGAVDSDGETSAGGKVLLKAGKGGAAGSSTGGDISVNAGLGGASGGNGGAFTLSAGATTTVVSKPGDGGSVSLRANAATHQGSGGDASLSGGDAFGLAQTGGQVSMTAGNSEKAVGGSVVLQQATVTLRVPSLVPLQPEAAYLCQLALVV